MRILSVSSFIILLLEGSAFSILWFTLPLNTMIYIVTHGLIAGLSAYWFSKHWQEASLSPSKVGFFVAVTLFLLPMMGAIVIWAIDKRYEIREKTIREKLADNTSQAKTDKRFHYFSTPEHDKSNTVKKTRDLLSTLDDDAYLKLLIASRNLPDKEAYNLLKEALTSPFESARLMAFSLKGALEDRLQKELQRKITALKLNPANRQQKADLHLKIAKDYIHLLDIGVISESNEMLLTQAAKHCAEAICIDRHSAYAFQSLSKVLKHQGKNEQAQRAHIKAINLGLPIERGYPTS